MIVRLFAFSFIIHYTVCVIRQYKISELQVHEIYIPVMNTKVHDRYSPCHTMYITIKVAGKQPHVIFVKIKS